MTETSYNNYYNYAQTTHFDFGGIVHPSDFGKRATLSEITARILADRKFDLECVRNRNLKKQTGGNNS